jgi:hypothetical protein
VKLCDIIDWENILKRRSNNLTWGFTVAASLIYFMVVPIPSFAAWHGQGANERWDKVYQNLFEWTRTHVSVLGDPPGSQVGGAKFTSTNAIKTPPVGIEKCSRCGRLSGGAGVEGGGEVEVAPWVVTTPKLLPRSIIRRSWRHDRHSYFPGVPR